MTRKHNTNAQLAAQAWQTNMHSHDVPVARFVPSIYDACVPMSLVLDDSACTSLQAGDDFVTARDKLVLLTDGKLYDMYVLVLQPRKLQVVQRLRILSVQQLQSLQDQASQGTYAV